MTSEKKADINFYKFKIFFMIKVILSYIFI